MRSPDRLRECAPGAMVKTFDHLVTGQSRHLGRARSSSAWPPQIIVTADIVIGSIRLDTGRLDDRPPLFDFGLLLGAECFGTLLFGRWNFLALVGHLLAHRWIS
jgi:hypothetical protein